MIIMKAEATKEEVENVVREIRKAGLKADVSVGEFRTIIGLIGDETRVSFSRLALLPGVKEARMVESPYKLISKEYGKRFAEESGESRVVKVGNTSIGNGGLVFIAGPCAVESRQQVMKIAEGIKKAGAQILRGGVFKPRSSVHAFQGLGASGPESAEEALHWLREAGDRFEMAVVTEVRGETQVPLVGKYVDMFQIGTRNMYDQDLITAVAAQHKPILYKRHFGAGIDEFLGFAEYIAAEGNKDIVLCERGILPLGKGRNYTRYTFDLGSIPAIQKETYLPVVADPSHATGRRDLIFNMSCAAVAAGACGLMIESHYNPAEALVDGQQMITPDELKEVIDACQQIRRVLASRKDKG
ncbi:MAG: 3-deoxy-7-phosphoheptulonate synthase [Chloroflexota bacterium]